MPELLLVAAMATMAPLVPLASRGVALAGSAAKPSAAATTKTAAPVAKPGAAPKPASASAKPAGTASPGAKPAPAQAAGPAPTSAPAASPSPAAPSAPAQDTQAAKPPRPTKERTPQPEPPVPTVVSRLAIFGGLALSALGTTTGLDNDQPKVLAGAEVAAGLTLLGFGIYWEIEAASIESASRAPSAAIVSIAAPRTAPRPITSADTPATPARGARPGLALAVDWPLP
jgi:hypothetical protein